MLNSWLPIALRCDRRRAPLETTQLEPEPEGDSGASTPVSPATAVLRDPGADPRAELTFLTELWVYYGLVGLRPEEVRLDNPRHLVVRCRLRSRGCDTRLAPHLPGPGHRLACHRLMVLKPRDRGFLHLSAESFGEPRWREAVIVSVEGEWVKTIVRCTQEELGASQLSALEQGGAHYCLVEAQDHQLRLGAQDSKMLLEADPKVLVAAAKQMLDSTDEELQYATASEPGRKKTAKPKAKLKKRVAENSESSSGGSSSQAATDTDPMLAQLRKSWLGSGMQKESRKEKTRSSSKKRGQRFSLLLKKKEDSEDEADNQLDVTTSLIEAAVKSEDPLRGLLALQLAQVTQPRKEKSKKSGTRRKSRATDSSQGSSPTASDSDSSSSDQQGKKGYASRKGARGGGPSFKLTDHNRRIHFGKQQNLKRCHYLFGIILDLILKEEYAQAGLQCVLSLQAAQQAALDGSWDVAWMLTHIEEPFKAKQFGGDPASLQHVTSYLKSMSELARNTKALKKKGSGKGDEDASTNLYQKDQAKGNKKGKQREKEKEKQTTDA
eukprot:s581_g13.t1